MRKSLATPQQGNGRRSMLGFGSAASKQKGIPEQKKLNFSANRSRLQNSTVGSKRWSSQGATAMKDPRTLTNRGFQKQLIDDILEFLSESGYPHPITPKILSAPTTKEFLRVFEHLYSCIDSNFNMTNKKIEEEVPKILKSLNYPFTISKSAMFSIGSLHSWPPLLGALHWLVELIKTFIEYYAQSYASYMRNEDEETEEKKRLLEETIILDAGCSAEDHEMLKDEVALLEQELAALETEPDPLEEAVKIKQILEEKMEKDEINIKELDQECVVLRKQALNYQKQLEEEAIDYKQLGDKLEKIKHKSTEVKRQLERLNNESERMDKQNNQREIQYTKLYDEINTATNKYNDIVKELILKPEIKNYLGNQSIALFYDHNIQDIYNTKQKLKSVLKKLSQQMTEDCLQLDSKVINEEIQINKMKEKISDEKEEIAYLNNKIEKLDRMLEDKTTRLEQHSGVFKSIEHQELQLENQLQRGLQTLQDEIQALEAKRLSVEEQSKKLSGEEDQFISEIVKYCEAIKQYKQDVKEGLKKLNETLQSDLNHFDEINKAYEAEE